MSRRPVWLTRANAITSLRLLLAPALATAIVEGFPLPAALIFWVAVATDVADGRVARRYGEETPYGRFFDHAVDATFVIAGNAALAAAGAVPAILPIAIALAFGQYALDSGSAATSKPRKSRLGHWNGIAYYVIVAVPVMRDAMGIHWPAAPWVLAGGWFLVASTVVSMVGRLRFARASE